MISVGITSKGIPKLSKKFVRLQKEIPQAGKRGIYQVLKEGKQIAVSAAPRYTGNLKKGIRRSSVKKNGNVISGTLSSSVPKSHPYHYWVNEEKGWRYARLGKRKTPTGGWPSKTLRQNFPKNIVSKWV